jgi:hypothetical protein
MIHLSSRAKSMLFMFLSLPCCVFSMQSAAGCEWPRAHRWVRCKGKDCIIFVRNLDSKLAAAGSDLHHCQKSRLKIGGCGQ